MSNPHRGPAAAHTIEDRRAMVRSGRLALVLPTQWENYALQMIPLKRAMLTDVTCPKCRRRVFTLYVYHDSKAKQLIAIRRCLRCNHAWEL